MQRQCCFMGPEFCAWIFLLGNIQCQSVWKLAIITLRASESVLGPGSCSRSFTDRVRLLSHRNRECTSICSSCICILRSWLKFYWDFPVVAVLLVCLVMHVSTIYHLTGDACGEAPKPFFRYQFPGANYLPFFDRNRVKNHSV